MGGQVAHDLHRATTDGVDPNLTIDPLDGVAPQVGGTTEDLGGLPRTELEGKAGLNLARGISFMISVMPP